MIFGTLEIRGIVALTRVVFFLQWSSLVSVKSKLGNEIKWKWWINIFF